MVVAGFGNVLKIAEQNRQNNKRLQTKLGKVNGQLDETNYIVEQCRRQETQGSAYEKEKPCFLKSDV